MPKLKNFYLQNRKVNLERVLAFMATFVILIGCEPTMPDSYDPISSAIPFFKADAGDDIILYIPTTRVRLNASRTLDTGRVVNSYVWRQIVDGREVGPEMRGLGVNVSFVGEGIYFYKLTATSDYGNKSYDTVKVTVIDNFALGIPPTFYSFCDTIYRYNQETIYFLETSAFVDSAGSRYDLQTGYSFTQLTGPSTARITTNPYLASGVSVENVSTGIYSFKVEVERKNMKVYDTLVLALLPDSVIGKEYYFESSWKENPDFAMNGIFAMAEVKNIQGLLLNKTGRVIRVWISEEGSSGWTEATDDWYNDLFLNILQCGDGIQILNQRLKDDLIIGKKLKVLIKIDS